MDFDSLGLENPRNFFLLKEAKGAIVHSEYSALGIWEQSFAKNVQVVPHFSEGSSETEDVTSIRKKYGLKDEIVAAAFGFVTVAKRIPSALKAFCKIVKRYPEKSFRFYVVGQADETQQEEIRKIIKQFKLKEYVALTGYTSPEIFEEYIDISDICINLRYPYGGETSGTLSRILGKGKACIVTDVGAFSEIPDICCVKIPSDPSSEEENIFMALKKLVEDPSFAKQIGECGRQYVLDNLSLKAVGLSYRNAIFSITKKPVNAPYLILERLASFIACNYFHDKHACVKWAVDRLMKDVWGVGTSRMSMVKEERH